jgi:hypothetical protein
MFSYFVGGENPKASRKLREIIESEHIKNKKF